MTTKIEVDVSKASKEALIDYAFELYRTINFYDMRSRLYDSVSKELAAISLESVRKAATIYTNAKDKRNPKKLPHLSYFVIVAKRLDEESRQRLIEQKNDKVIWGKTI